MVKLGVPFKKLTRTVVNSLKDMSSRKCTIVPEPKWIEKDTEVIEEEIEEEMTEEEIMAHKCHHLMTSG